MAQRLGVRAISIDGTNRDAWSTIDRELAADEIDLLLISPERLANERFRTKTVPAISKGIGLFVVDEAHCISDWGHDFRPDYRRIRSLTQNLPAGVPLLATTATANDRVVADVEEQLGPDLAVIRGELARKSLYMQVIRLDDPAERLAWLLEYLRGAPGSGIVYVLTKADALRVSRWLNDHGIDAPAYHGALDHEIRANLEERLLRNEVNALVSTVALGMGFDKPDLEFVVHFQRPSSVIAYYQQIGRAGRALDRAEVILLTGAEDDEIAAYFIDEAFPPEDVMRAVLAATEAEGGATVSAIETAVNAKHSTIEGSLKLLEVDGAVGHEGSSWFRTTNPWDLGSERIASVTATREAELERMQLFVETEDCLMSFVTGELDGPDTVPCGRCANCVGPFVAEGVAAALVDEANVFLKRAYVPIEPRKQWLADRRRNIPPEFQLEEGRALSRWGVSGWGTDIRRGKFDGDGFSDALVEATATMIGVDLATTDPPTWVTSVPSLRHDIVPDFARRLADRLALPYREALIKVKDTPQQKTMENGPQQERNVTEAFAVLDAEVDPGPVLLVDDMVDSRWTFTVCGVALRKAGSGAVYPVALADTGSGGGS
jgi:ATP-dependent DNA helicase RecQ